VLAGWIGGLIAAVPAPDERHRIELQSLVDCARVFVADCAARASALDALAAASLGDALGELRALGDFRCPLAGTPTRQSAPARPARRRELWAAPGLR
jgi:hypothetical protein